MMSTQRSSPGVGPVLAHVRPRVGGRMTVSFVTSMTACSLALGGCGGEGASVAASASAVPTASPTSAWTAEQLAKREAALAMPLPEQPANMNENSEAGAVATAKYMVQLYPYLYATGDLKQWRSISRDDCKFCNDVIRDVEELHEAGGWRDPWDHTVTQAKYVEPGPEDKYPDCPRVFVSFDESASYYYKNIDTEPKIDEPTVGTRVVFAMKYEDERWVIREVGVL